MMERIYHLLKRRFFALIRKSTWIWPQYQIRGCRTFNHRDLVELKNPWVLNRPLEDYLNQLESQLAASVQSSSPLSVMRVGDGEALFLSGKFVGNIRSRHFTRSNEVSLEELRAWKERLLKNDLISFDMNWSLRKLWVPHVGSQIKTDFFPLNAIYAAVASRELFRWLKGRRIGLIGPRSKLDLIKTLSGHSEYSEYLGISFSDYLEIPEKGACNQADTLCEDLLKQIQSQPCDVYLLGMGISKLYVQSELRDRSGKIFIDIGCGLDAIAGIVPNDRPYFGDWINYRISRYRYDNIDMLSWKTPPEKLYRLGAPMPIELSPT